jgi:hypothetical protein
VVPLGAGNCARGVSYRDLQLFHYLLRVKEQEDEGKLGVPFQALFPWTKRGVLPFGDIIVTVFPFEEVNSKST